MPRCAVLGSPIAHSLSPVLHRAGYAALGLSDWSYHAYEVDEPGLPGFLAGCGPDWRGLSLTMPLKLAAAGLGEPDDNVRLTGAANTLIFGPEGRRVHNTDVDGMVNALRAAGVDCPRRVTVLAAGGTARAAVAAAGRLGADAVTVLARTPARAEPLRAIAGRLGLAFQLRPWPEPLAETDLLISTGAAGAADARAEEAAARAPVIFEVLYDPWPTRLAAAAQRRGAVLLGGLDLLVGQAVLQFELMTGRRLDPAVMMSAGREALGHRPTA